MAMMTSPMPDTGNAKSVDEKLDILLNSYYLLRKEIEYSLQNIDLSNLGDDLSNKLKSVDKELDINASNLNNAIESISTDLQAISDGQIVTYYQSEEPIGKLGDLWFDTATKKLYRFSTIWNLVEDKDITTAIQAAQNAQSTADGKIVSFYQAEMPSVEVSNVGDLWIDLDDNNKLYRFNGTSWKVVSDTRIDKVLSSSGKLLAKEIEGIMNTAVAMIQNGDGTVSFDDRGLIVHDKPLEINSTKAVLVSSGGILIANSKDTNGNWQWQTAITGDSINADLITTGTLKAINVQGVNITGSSMHIDFDNGGFAKIDDNAILVQHIDGSHTKIDGRGITRIFSVPIFTQLPSGTNIIDNFETGNIANTRVDYPSSSYYGFIANTSSTIADFVKITTLDKYAGTYGLRVELPPRGMYVESSTWKSNVLCAFIPYRPTKDTNFTMKYKYVPQPDCSAYLYVDDLDYPAIPTQIISLTSTTWSTASALLTKYHTYRIYVMITYRGSSTGRVAILYLDNIEFELNVSESVITGYTESPQPYYDFTYVRKDKFLKGVTQKQIVLPDYFKGMNFDVIIHPGANWDWKSTYPSTVVLNSVNNLIPSFTVSCDRYPDVDVDFAYTVILNY